MIKCPYCGSEDYDTYDNQTWESQNIDYCQCEFCDGLFKVIYKFSHVEED